MINNKYTLTKHRNNAIIFYYAARAPVHYVTRHNLIYTRKVSLIDKFNKFVKQFSLILNLDQQQVHSKSRPWNYSLNQYS